VTSWLDYSLSLPLPTRANDLVMPVVMGSKVVKGKKRPFVRLIKTNNAREWLEDALFRLGLEEPSGSAPLEGPLILAGNFYLPSIASDLDGRLKALQDALTQAGVYHDDKQITCITVRKRINVEGDQLRTNCVRFRLKVDTDCDLEVAKRLEASMRNRVKLTPNYTANK
jgi:hypothetical protein